jgi:hypothetical protein
MMLSDRIHGEPGMGILSRSSRYKRHTGPFICNGIITALKKIASDINGTFVTGFFTRKQAETI